VNAGREFAIEHEAIFRGRSTKNPALSEKLQRTRMHVGVGLREPGPFASVRRLNPPTPLTDKIVRNIQIAFTMTEG